MQKDETAQRRWNDFSINCLKLHDLLYGVNARARKLAMAGREQNADYICEDLFSLFGAR